MRGRDWLLTLLLACGGLLSGDSLAQRDPAILLLAAPAPGLSSISLQPADLFCPGSTSGVVSLTGQAPSGGIVVNLSSTSTQLTLPPTVTVPAGAATASFKVTGSQITENYTRTVSASLNGIVRQASIYMHPGLERLAINPSEVTGGDKSLGEVRLWGPAPPQGAVVSISDNGNAVQTSASVSIPAGAKAATFNITTSLVGVTYTGVVTATLGSYTRTAPIKLTPGPRLSSFAISPETIVGGGTASGTISLSEPTPANGRTIYLSDNGESVSVPASVRALPGATLAGFPIFTQIVTVNTIRSVTVSVAGLTQSDLITLVPRPRFSDIVINSFAWSPANPVAGQPVTFSATISNKGIFPIPAGPSLVARFYIDGQERSNGVNRNGVPLGGTATISGSTVWPATAGTHKLEVRIDESNRIPELDESNNHAETALTVAGSSLPNLAVASVLWDKTDAIPGSSVRFRAVVTNRGTASITPDKILNLRFSVNGSQVATGSVAGITLAPRASVTISAQGVWTAAKGLHTVSAQADYNNSIPEGDESDNAASIKWSISDTPMPDLVVDSYTTYPTKPMPNDTVQLIATIRNQGTAATPLGGVIGTKFIFSGSAAVPDLPELWNTTAVPVQPGQTMTVTANGGSIIRAYCWPPVAGSYPIQVNVDDAQRIVESAENNNGLSATFAVATRPAAEVGAWSGIHNWISNAADDRQRRERVAVHMHLLTTGKVLAWSRDPNDMGHVGGICRPTKAILWDPATPDTPPITINSAKMVDCLFCAGHCILPNGKVLSAGGHIADDNGIPATYLFDPNKAPGTDPWTKIGNMNRGRWYPSTTVLADGSAIVIGGRDEVGAPNLVPQILRPGALSWESLNPSPANLVDDYYPWTYSAPNGKLFVAGNLPKTYYLDPISETWSFVAESAYGSRGYGSSAMLSDYRILNASGSKYILSPTPSCETIDLEQTSPAWTYAGSLTYGRRHGTLTLLPDETALMTGGTMHEGNDAAGSIMAAELFNPGTNTWTRMSASKVSRLYHSNALLLPDGRVVVSGGGVPSYAPIFSGSSVNQPGAFPTAEIFSPPYLFKGARPTITGVSKTVVGYGSTFDVTTPDWSGIEKVTWIKLSSVTHAFNMNQRINKLGFQKVSGKLVVSAPTDRKLCTPGHYMLFILNAKGIPSVARIIQIL